MRDAFAAVGRPQNADLLFRRVSLAFHGLGSFFLALTNNPGRLKFSESGHARLSPVRV